MKEEIVSLIEVIAEDICLKLIKKRRKLKRWNKSLRITLWGHHSLKLQKITQSSSNMVIWALFYKNWTNPCSKNLKKSITKVWRWIGLTCWSLLRKFTRKTNKIDLFISSYFHFPLFIVNNLSWRSLHFCCFYASLWA